MPCRFASSGPVATSRSASRAILALNAASNFLRDLVISVLHRLRQSRTLHTLTFGAISGVHITLSAGKERKPSFVLLDGAPELSGTLSDRTGRGVFTRVASQSSIAFQCRNPTLALGYL